MTKLKQFTYEDIKSWRPCYDPAKFIPKNWKGTALDILKLENVSVQDKFWCVFRKDIIDDKILRLFAVWSYRETLKFINNPDSRSIEAVNIAEKYALGEVTGGELQSARMAAWSAAKSAAKSTESAAWSAQSAAQSTAESAAWSAWSAAESATRSAAWSAESAAESAQLNRLIEMLEEE